MSDDVIGIVQHQVGRDRGVGRAGKTADQENDYTTQHEQHRRWESDLAPPEGCHPGKELDPGRHSHQQGAVHERFAQVFSHASGEHVMAPDQEAGQGNAQGGHGHPLIAIQRLADKYRQ